MSVGRHSRSYEPGDASASDYFGLAPLKQSARRFEPLERYADGNRSVTPVEGRIFVKHGINPKSITREMEWRRDVDARASRACRGFQVDKDLYDVKGDQAFLEEREILSRERKRDESAVAEGRLMFGEQKRIYSKDYTNERDGNSHPENYVTEHVIYKFGDGPATKMADSSVKKSLAGLIFMCNDRIRRSCFRYGVLGMPMAKKHLVDQVKPGTKLFLFEFEARVLWGVYEATTHAGLDLEPDAYRGSEVAFPAQVRFRVCKKCNPLAEQDFQVAIEGNYYEPSKFKFELTVDQVLKLMRLFSPRETVTKQVNDTVALGPSLLTRNMHYKEKQLALKDPDALTSERKNTWGKDLDDTSIAVSRHHHSQIKHENFKDVTVLPANGWTEKVERSMSDKVVENSLKTGNTSQVGFAGVLQSYGYPKKQSARDVQAARLSLNLSGDRPQESYLEQNWRNDRYQIEPFYKDFKEKHLVYRGLQSGPERIGQLIDSKKDLVKQMNVANYLQQIKKKEDRVDEDECLYLPGRQHLSRQSLQTDLNLKLNTIKKLPKFECNDHVEARLARKQQSVGDHNHSQPASIGGWTYSISQPLCGSYCTKTTDRNGNNVDDEPWNLNASYRKHSSSYTLENVDGDISPVSLEFSAGPGNSTMTCRNDEDVGFSKLYPGSTMMIGISDNTNKDVSKRTDFALQEDLENEVHVSVTRKFGKSFRAVRVNNHKDFPLSEQRDDASRAWRSRLGEDSVGKKSSVWSRLSGPAKVSVDKGPVIFVRDQNLELLDSRERFLKKRKWLRTLLDQCPSGSEIERDEDLPEAKIEDSQEDFVVDFKRRKCRPHDSSSIKIKQNDVADAPGGVCLSQLAGQGSRDSAGSQKGRRKLIRPVLVDNNQYTLQTGQSSKSSEENDAETVEKINFMSDL